MAMKGAINSVVAGTRCVTCLAKNETKIGGYCRKCKQVYKPAEKENVPRLKRSIHAASVLQPSTSSEQLKPLYAKHTGSFIGKGTSKLSQDLDDSTLVYQQVHKRKQKDSQRQSLSAKEVTFHNRASIQMRSSIDALNSSFASLSKHVMQANKLTDKTFF